MNPVTKIRQKFCKHVYPTYWHPTFIDPGTVTFTKTCKKCGAVTAVSMPLDNVEPVWWKLQSIRKHYYIH